MRRVGVRDRAAGRGPPPAASRARSTGRRSCCRARTPALRLSLEEWFRKQGIRPRVVGTFEDSALIDAFGQAGAGLFAMPSAIDAEVRRQYRVRLVGRLDAVRQRFYAITVERKLRNPAVIAISERARALFA